MSDVTIEKLEEGIWKCLDECGIPRDQCESLALGDMGLDSLDTVEIIVSLEMDFEIEIPDASIEDNEARLIKMTVRQAAEWAHSEFFQKGQP